ncbi:MAG: sulfite exporter TauE/SafE family protein [Candidatus Acidiferrum sp.]
MSIAHAIFLFAAAALGGAINAVAGGGSFISFPALLFTGVAPVPANATNTLALWLGVTASGGAYRNRMSSSRRVLIPLIATSALGGVAGALLLIKTPGQTFLKVLPWLLMGATLLFAFGKPFTRRMAAGNSGAASGKTLAGATAFELLVALYGGYFGGGMGILNLAMLSALGMTDIHEMNALKVILSSVINGVAAVTFIISGAILWPQAGVMIVGAILGGYFAARWAQRLPQAWIRNFVIFVGTGMTIYFFVRAYL